MASLLTQCINMLEGIKTPIVLPPDIRDIIREHHVSVLLPFLLWPVMVNGIYSSNICQPNQQNKHWQCIASAKHGYVETFLYVATHVMITQSK